MFIKQADLLWGLDKGFIKSLMDMAHKEHHDAGSFLFTEGESADSFYLMLKGRVRLVVSPSELHVHIVAHAGETFGWSGLVGRDYYSSTGECVEDTILMRFDCSEILELCTKDSETGRQFFQRLAGTLGHRLINSYSVDHIHAGYDDARTFGSRQMIDSELTT